MNGIAGSTEDFERTLMPLARVFADIARGGRLPLLVFHAAEH